MSLLPAQARISEYGVLYLDEAVVRQVADDIRGSTPLINTMSLQPDLAGFADLFQQMAPVVEIGEAPQELSGFLNKITKQSSSRPAGKPGRLIGWLSVKSLPH